LKVNIERTPNGSRRDVKTNHHGDTLLDLVNEHAPVRFSAVFSAYQDKVEEPYTRRHVRKILSRLADDEYLKMEKVHVKDFEEGNPFQNVYLSMNKTPPVDVYQAPGGGIEQKPMERLGLND
jgi:hypothetical protein